MRRRSLGFTMMELMVIMVIIGILAAIAFPSYGQYVLRGNRAAGKAKVMEIAAKQESYFNDRKTYAVNLTAMNPPSGPNNYPANTFFLRKNGLMSATSTGDSIYSITLAPYSAVASTNSCGMSGTLTAPVLQYVIVAIPVNQQTKDTTCARLCYSHLGEKGVSGTATDCWSR